MGLNWNYGDLIEAVGQRVPERVALIHGEIERTWRQLDERSNRLARALLATPGIEYGDHVAFCLSNRPEYLEGFAAASKARLVHLNINYRYVEDELFEVLDRGDASVVIYEEAFADEIAKLAPRLHKVKLFIEAGSSKTPRFDGAASYEAVAGGGDASPLGIERSGDDLFFMYTGGTTGAPKAVMWRHADRLAVYKDGDATETPEQFLERSLARPALRVLPGPPLMHSTGLTSALFALVSGGAVVTVEGSFEPIEMWEQIATHDVAGISIVGDAFARPLLSVLDHDLAARLRSLQVITSAGVMWSEEVKQGLLEYLPWVALRDTLGSSEGSGLGVSITTASRASSQTARFGLGTGCKVFTPDHREVEPGSGEAGLIAKSGAIPVGYYNDPERSAATFPVIDGVRYSIPGDWCTLDADATITLLGRGSNCINTGGEKVYPEEVEEALKSLDGISDALAFGVADERWGQAVTAVVKVTQARGEHDIRAALRDRLAGYKIPKRIFAVDRVPRGANGKPDYAAAKELAS